MNRAMEAVVLAGGNTSFTTGSVHVVDGYFSAGPAPK